MRISRQKLRKLIREECGVSAVPEEVGPEVGPVDVAPPAPGPMLESAEPVAELMVEMEVATRALEQVVESVQNAAHLCPDCGDSIAAQTPIMEAVVTQAEALQEMLEAQQIVVSESTEHVEAEIAVIDI